MTLLINGRFLRREVTGLHRAGRALLTELRRSGYRIEVVAPRGVEDSLVDRVRSGVASDAVWEQTTLPIVARGRFLFSPTNTAPLLGRNIVWTHDLGPLVNPDWYAGRRARYYGKVLLSVALRARAVFAPSTQVARELVAAGVRPSRVSVIRSPVDPCFRMPSEAEVGRIRQRFDLERDYVVQLGAYSPRKDARFAVEAHVRASKKFPHDLVLVGQPHDMFAPVTWRSVPSVRAVGYVPDEHLPALLGGAAALLSPSRYEGFGLPPLEALCCGTQALVSDIPAHRESTWGLAELLPLDDLEAWASAIVRALSGETVPPSNLPRWTSADMVDQFVSALPAGVRRLLETG